MHDNLFEQFLQESQNQLAMAKKMIDRFNRNQRREKLNEKLKELPEEERADYFTTWVAEENLRQWLEGQE